MIDGPEQVLGRRGIPMIIADAGSRAVDEYRSFFGSYDNIQTRRSYESSAWRFFSWAEDRGLSLTDIHAFDVIFFEYELEGSVQPWTVAGYCKLVGKLFGRLKQAGVIGENPFDEDVPAGGIAADTDAAVAWQATVDAAELSRLLNELQRAGFADNSMMVKKQLCERVIALGKARMITPDYDAIGSHLAAMLGGKAPAGTTPDQNDNPTGVAGEADRQSPVAAGHPAESVDKVFIEASADTTGAS